MATLPPYYCTPAFLSASTPPPFPAIQFYEMAANDKVCGNNLVALKDLDLGAWIDRPDDVDCEEQRWIGAPDQSDYNTDDAKRYLRRGPGPPRADPCADVNVYTTSFLAWFFFLYTVLWEFQCSCLVVLIQRARRAMLFDIQRQALANVLAIAAPAAVPVVDVDTDAA